MANKWIALNLLLLIAAVGLARELQQQYEQFKTKNDPSKIELVSAENQAAAKTAPGASIDTFLETPVNADADYYIISEKTVFSNLRGSEEEIVPVPAKVPALPNPKPILVGTTIVDGQYTASVVINPTAAKPAPGGQVATETWRVGDLYRGYMVTSIEPEQMVLENSGMREVFQLNRAARRAPAAKSPINTATRVVSIGQGGGASGAITVSTAAAAPGRGAVQTAAQNTAARQAQQAVQQAQQAVQQALQQAQQTAQQQQQQRIPVSPDMLLTLPETGVLFPAQGAQPDQQTAQPAQKPKTIVVPKPNQGARQQTQQQQQRSVLTPFGEIIRPGSE